MATSTTLSSICTQAGSGWQPGASPWARKAAVRMHCPSLRGPILCSRHGLLMSRPGGLLDRQAAPAAVRAGTALGTPRLALLPVPPWACQVACQQQRLFAW